MVDKVWLFTSKDNVQQIRPTTSHTHQLFFPQ